jgi:hypothetical protein
MLSIILYIVVCVIHELHVLLFPIYTMKACFYVVSKSIPSHTVSHLILLMNMIRITEVLNHVYHPLRFIASKPKASLYALHSTGRISSSSRRGSCGVKRSRLGRGARIEWKMFAPSEELREVTVIVLCLP